MWGHAQSGHAGRFVLVVLAVVTANLIFGTYGVVSKVVYSAGTDPLTFVFLRNLLAAPLLFTAAWFVDGVRSALPHPQDYAVVFWLGLTGHWGNMLFNAVGIKLTTPFFSALVMQGIPIFTMILSVILGREQLNPLTPLGFAKIIGALISIGGAVVIIACGQGVNEPGTAPSTNDGSDPNARDSPNDSGNGNHLQLLLGNAYLVINCISYASSLFFQQNLLQTGRYHPLTVAYFGYASGAMILAISFVSSGISSGWGNVVFTLSWQSFFGLGYAVLLTSCVAYGLLSWANRASSPVVLVVFVPLQVAVTCILSAIFLNYSFGWADAGGALMVVCGSLGVVAAKYLESKKSKKHSQSPPDGTAASAEDDTSHQPQQRSHEDIDSASGVVIHHSDGGEIAMLEIANNSLDSSPSDASSVAIPKISGFKKLHQMLQWRSPGSFSAIPDSDSVALAVMPSLSLLPLDYSDGPDNDIPLATSRPSKWVNVNESDFGGQRLGQFRHTRQGGFFRVATNGDRDTDIESLHLSANGLRVGHDSTFDGVLLGAEGRDLEEEEDGRA